MTTQQHTDRELLELAAKAAGKTVVRYADDEYGLVCRDDDGLDFFWNPLTDDGDALRLAVALQLNVCNEHVTAGEVYCMHGEKVFPGVLSGAECDGPAADHVIPEDYAATRRAIVLAAAAIGRAMP